MVESYAFVVSGDLLSTGEAAKLLGVHRSTVLRYVQEGKLPAQTLPGRHVRVRREDVEKLLKTGPPGDREGRRLQVEAQGT